MHARKRARLIIADGRTEIPAEGETELFRINYERIPLQCHDYEFNRGIHEEKLEHSIRG